MVHIAPFKAIRYNPSKVPNLSKAICPPYDVISITEYHRLVQRHPFNAVRVELPMNQGREDRYALSGTFWRRWQNQRILIEDREPSYYGYEQRFTIGGQAHVRRGFFAALRLERPGRGHVRPHERTFAKHKEDRLQLMRATHANISPIFGIFFDGKERVQDLLSRHMAKPALAVARDDKGVTHRLWRWTDPEVVKTLSASLRPEDVLIADGHHRYETAWNYARERAARASRASHQAYWYVLSFLCPLSDPGLVIQPTHRSLQWDASVDEWRARIPSFYSVRSLPSLNSLLALLRRPNQPRALALVLAHEKILWLAPKPGAPQTLPVVILHERFLKDVPPEAIRFGQNPRDVVESIQRGEANAAFLLMPPDKDEFARIARSGRLLPQKSTYFYPKVITGMVMRSLDGDV